MRIRRLRMKNFRSVANGEVLFPGHTAVIGGNSVGKSTMCEALDLCLGPDRLSRSNPVNEHDFYQRRYIDDDNTALPNINIDVRKLLVRSESDFLDIINNGAVHTDGVLMKYVVQNYLQAIEVQ